MNANSRTDCLLPPQCSRRCNVSAWPTAIAKWDLLMCPRSSVTLCPQGMVKRTVLHLRLTNEEGGQLPLSCGKHKEQMRQRQEHIEGTSSTLYTVNTYVVIVVDSALVEGMSSLLWTVNMFNERFHYCIVDSEHVQGTLSLLWTVNMLKDTLSLLWTVNMLKVRRSVCPE